MKITIVLGAFFPVPPILGGAVEKVWLALAQEFVRQGHEVTQVSRRHPQLADRETVDGVEHIRVPGADQPASLLYLKWLDLLYSLRVRHVLPAADILVSNTFWLPVVVRRKDRGRLYVHVQRGPKGQMRWYRRAARLCAVSQAIAEDIIAQAPDLRAKVRVIPNALPFRIEETTNAGRGRTILFVGRVHPEKGIELFLGALALLPEQIKSLWQVKIVGPHETELGGGGEMFLQEMQSLGEKSGMKIEWTGKIFDPAALTAQYRSAKIFVYPSVAETGETFGLAPLEAMANGCVPVVSALACFRDFIQDGVNGFVFDHRAVEPEKNFAARLLQVMESEPANLEMIAEKAQAKAAEFTVEPVAQRYLADFATLLNPGPHDD